jgi:hypothetical protein
MGGVKDTLSPLACDVSSCVCILLKVVMLSPEVCYNDIAVSQYHNITRKDADMSMQRRDSHHQLLDPEHDILVTKLQNEHPKSLDIVNDMEIAYYQPPKHLEFSRDTEPDSTKTLHGEQDGKPAIALTAYKNDYSPHEGFTSSTSLLHLFKPIDVSEISDRAAPSLSTPTEEEKSQRSAVELRLQLERHFEGLKREFEITRGKGWTPLRAWLREEWEWGVGSGRTAVLRWRAW